MGEKMHGLWSGECKT